MNLVGGLCRPLPQGHPVAIDRQPRGPSPGSGRHDTGLLSRHSAGGTWPSAELRKDVDVVS
jgi:hypothetical protein